MKSDKNQVGWCLADTALPLLKIIGENMFETYNAELYDKNGISLNFVQD